MTMINERVAGKDISLGKSTLRKSPKRTSRFLESKKEGCFSKPCARSFLNSQSDYTFDNFCEKSCCFLEAGIVSLSLPPDFTWMGPAACERCARLQLVDLSRTEISEIMGSTFAHCSHLQQLNLSNKLRRIGREAFLKCTSLREVHTPPTLLYIARRAFAGCMQLCTFHKPERERHGGGHTLRPMPLTNVDILTYQSGSTSSRRTQIAVVTCGLMTSVRSCARTCISFAKLC